MRKTYLLAQFAKNCRFIFIFFLYHLRIELKNYENKTQGLEDWYCSRDMCADCKHVKMYVYCSSEKPIL